MRSLTPRVWLICVIAAVTLLAAAPEEQNTDKCSLEIPEAEKNRKNPVPASPESLERGKTIFSSQCAMCHGEKGDGKGKLAEKYDFKSVDFTDAARQKQRTDGEYFYILTKGCGHMPGEGERLPEAWKWDLVNHIRTLASGS
jgi:cytochrome c5